jgi:hypothetical protein
MKRIIRVFLIIVIVEMVAAVDKTHAQDTLKRPKIWLELRCDSTNNLVLIDRQDSTKMQDILLNRSETNFNHSVIVNDTSMFKIIYDSLSMDSMVTVLTAYQTEEDTVVGVWEVVQDTNRIMWLNSQKVSYKNFGIRYRKNTENGVIVNTTQFVYPTVGDSIGIVNEVDTLFMGREGKNKGEKNFCEYIYIKGTIDSKEQQEWESYLAIKYGALLHNIYVNSHHDTLWDSKVVDSIYSKGVAGIGRDDVFPLYQIKSKIYKDSLIIERKSAFDRDKSFLMWGHNKGENVVRDTTFIVDTIIYHPIERVWKARAETSNEIINTKITYNYPIELNVNTIRMVVNTQDSDIYGVNSIIYAPTEITDSSVVFDNIIWSNDIDYYVSIVMKGDSIYKPIATKSTVDNIKGSIGSEENEEIEVMVSPNPSERNYTITVRQKEAKPLSIYVIDSQGKIVYQEDKIEAMKDYTLRHRIEQKGAYMINVQTAKTKKAVKLIIAR